MTELNIVPPSIAEVPDVRSGGQQRGFRMRTLGALGGVGAALTFSLLPMAVASAEGGVGDIARGDGCDITINDVPPSTDGTPTVGGASLTVPENGQCSFDLSRTYNPSDAKLSVNIYDFPGVAEFRGTTLTLTPYVDTSGSGAGVETASNRKGDVSAKLKINVPKLAQSTFPDLATARHAGSVTSDPTSTTRLEVSYTNANDGTNKPSTPTVTFTSDCGYDPIIAPGVSVPDVIDQPTATQRADSAYRYFTVDGFRRGPWHGSFTGSNGSTGTIIDLDQGGSTIRITDRDGDADCAPVGVAAAPAPAASAEAQQPGPAGGHGHDGSDGSSQATGGAVAPRSGGGSSPEVTSGVAQPSAAAIGNDPKRGNVILGGPESTVRPFQPPNEHGAPIPQSALNKGLILGLEISGGIFATGIIGGMGYVAVTRGRRKPPVVISQPISRMQNAFVIHKNYSPS